MGVMIEHYAGNFPVWLSPEQVRILPIGERQNEYANKVFEELKKADLRVEIDDTNESLGKKIRNAKQMKVPYMLVIGDQEVADNTVTVESRKEKISALSLSDFLTRIQEEIKTRTDK
jgi:threonyl-tRNA synthetase